MFLQLPKVVGVYPAGHVKSVTPGVSHTGGPNPVTKDVPAGHIGSTVSSDPPVVAGVELVDVVGDAPSGVIFDSHLRFL